MAKKVALVENVFLKPHERARKKHIAELVDLLQHDGFMWDPVLVDKNTMIILDGHHRCAALRQLGLSRVPVRFVDYNQEQEVRVTSWRKGERITKNKVIQAGLSGKLMRIKTSRHLYDKKGFSVHIPLKNLK